MAGGLADQTELGVAYHPKSYQCMVVGICQQLERQNSGPRYEVLQSHSNTPSTNHHPQSKNLDQPQSFLFLNAPNPGNNACISQGVAHLPKNKNCQPLHC